MRRAALRSNYTRHAIRRGARYNIFTNASESGGKHEYDIKKRRALLLLQMK
jgi:hypothetical protein